MITAIIVTIGTMTITIYLPVPRRAILANTFLPIVCNMVIFTKATVSSSKFNVLWNLIVKKSLADMISRMLFLK